MDIDISKPSDIKRLRTAMMKAANDHNAKAMVTKGRAKRRHQKLATFYANSTGPLYEVAKTLEEK